MTVLAFVPSNTGVTSPITIIKDSQFKENAIIQPNIIMPRGIIACRVTLYVRIGNHKKYWALDLATVLVNSLGHSIKQIKYRSAIMSVSMS